MPLYIAAQNGHETVARLLLERGAAVNAATKVSCPSVSPSRAPRAAGPTVVAVVVAVVVVGGGVIVVEE